jgi:hypothetical protein
MVKSRDLRDVAVSHYKNGKKAPEIAKLLANKVHRSTIDRWLTRYRQSGSFEAKPKSGRPKAGRTKRLINLVQKRLDSDNRRKTLRTMAKDFNSSVQTIKRVLNLDLHKKCYRKISVQNLKDEQKPIRKTCCQWLRKNINYDKLKRLMFTDEKIFTKNGYFNPKNDVVWADDRSDANERGGLHSTEKYPMSIMVGLGVTWNGPTRPFFFQKGERLNGQTYHDQLLPFYQKEGYELFGHNDWGLQQDGASSHTDAKIQQWCRNHFNFFIPKARWPPNSPELNPLDYSIWDSISNHIEYGKVETINDLRREVKKSIKKLDVNYVRDTINVFLRRVRSVEKHNGELIFDEHS